MAVNDYFDSTKYTALTAHSLGRAANVNSTFALLEAAFTLLPSKTRIREDRITYVTDTGAADAYIATLTEAPPSYTAGLKIAVKALTTNTGASTINVNGLGIKNIKKSDGTALIALAAGDIFAGAIFHIQYDGTQFQLISAATSVTVTAAASATAAASSATNAATSATNAATSATNAAASATAAATSETNALASATSAATAETNAELAETNAETAETNANNAARSVAFRWNFDSSTTMADPGTGDIRFNNATLSAATAAAISDLTGDTGNPDASVYVLAWDDSTTTSLRGTLLIRQVSAPEDFVVFNVTGASTDNVGWTQLDLTYVGGAGAFTNTDALTVQFVRTGNQGADGAGVGDLLAANNLSDVASAATSRTNLGLGTAAVANTGVADGNVPLMDAVGYPAADGSQITNISGGGFTLGTEQATASGASVTFGSIPAGTKMVVLHFEGVSTVDAANIKVQIGDTGGIETTGYYSSAATLTTGANGMSTGNVDVFIVTSNASAANAISGSMFLTLKDDTDFTWISSHSVANEGVAAVHTGGGRKSLSAELTQVKIMPGSGNFDAGSINIMYIG